MQNEYILLITLGFLLVFNPTAKHFLERIGIPPLIGYILTGFLISAIGERWSLGTPASDNTFSVLAQLGLITLLFRVGLQSHIRALLAKLPDASLIWVGDITTNLLFGFVTSYYVLALPIETSLVIATAFSATSVAVSIVVWDKLKKLNTSEGQLLVDVAELDDLSGVLLLAILLAVIPTFNEPGNGALAIAGQTTLLTLIKLALFITGCYLFSSYVEPALTRLTRRWKESNREFTIAVFGTALTIAAIAGYLGFTLAIGALFAGLAFSRDPRAVHNEAKFAYFHEFFAPFFFIHIGMQVEMHAVIPALGLAAVLFGPAVLGKLLGVALPALTILKRYSALLLGLSMIPRAEIAMVVVYQSQQLLGEEIIAPNLFAAMVLISVLTSLVTPLILLPLLARKTMVA